VGALLFLLTGCASTAEPAPTSVTPNATSSGIAATDWVPYFSEEFDEATWIDRGWLWFVHPRVWGAYWNTYGDGNNELACLTPDNLGVDNGELRITAKREVITCPSGSQRDFSSGFLSSRDAGRMFPLFGRYEIRARVPHGQGLWPAFWLRHANGAGEAEVDVMEYFHSQVPGEVTQTLHFPNSISRNTAKSSTFIESGDQPSKWHTYAVEITSGPQGAVQFQFFVDGQPTLEYLNTDPSSWVDGTDPARTWDMAVNLAVGGDWSGNPDAETLGFLDGPNVCSITGVAPPDGNPQSCSTDGIRRAEFPAVFDVDYVRVFVPTNS